MSDAEHLVPEYLVVVNGEEQYSIWEAGTPAPAGWHAEGFSGTKEQCLARIEQVWTDMRPLSLRTVLDSHTAVNGSPALNGSAPGGVGAGAAE